MNTEKSISSTWNVNRLRSGLLNDPSSGQDTRPLLQAFLKLKSHILVIRQLAEGEQAKLLEIIDQVSAVTITQTISVLMLTIPIINYHEQAAPTDLTKDTKLVAALGEISSDTGLLPNSLGSLQGLEKRGEIAVASGGATDIWRGILNNKPVAFKAFRIYPPQDLQEAKKILWKLVPIWKRLAHENILPFRGVDMSIFQLALVYDWGHDGNIMQYLESHPNVSRPKLVTVPPFRTRLVSSSIPQVAPSRQRSPVSPLSRYHSRGSERSGWRVSFDPRHADDEIHLGQCRNIRDWDSSGL